MKVQSNFADRISRIEKGATFGGMEAFKGEKLVHTAKPKRKLHWDMLALGGVAGGVAGTLFAMNVGVAFLLTLNVDTLYQLVLADYVTAAYIAGVAVAPVGFVLSQIFARSNPRGWQLWIGYLGGVLAANHSDLLSYYHIFLSSVT